MNTRQKKEIVAELLRAGRRDLARAAYAAVIKRKTIELGNVGPSGYPQWIVVEYDGSTPISFSPKYTYEVEADSVPLAQFHRNDQLIRNLLNRTPADRLTNAALSLLKELNKIRGLIL